MPEWGPLVARCFKCPPFTANVGTAIFRYVSLCLLFDLVKDVPLRVDREVSQVGSFFVSPLVDLLGHLVKPLQLNLKLTELFCFHVWSYGRQHLIVHVVHSLLCPFWVFQFRLGYVTTC